MTNEEIIELQKKDIATLQAQRKFLAEQIVRLQQKPTSVGDRKYSFDTPYFRIDSYGIYCYRLVSTVDYKWGTKYEMNTEYRFSEVFSYSLHAYNSVSFGTYRNGCYGNRKFTTCISYDDLMKKLKRRTAINYNNKGNEYRKLIDDINKSLFNNLDSFDESRIPAVKIEEE